LREIRMGLDVNNCRLDPRDFEDFSRLFQVPVSQIWKRTASGPAAKIPTGEAVVNGCVTRQSAAEPSITPCD
jgi:hypothetical protein